MKTSILALLSTLLCWTISGQDYFLKKYNLGATEISGYSIDNYSEDSFLIAGLKVSSDTTLHLYVGLLDQEGSILQYDSIEQVEFEISISRNNDFLIDDQNNIKFFSVGSGRTVIYDYKVNTNQLSTEDTISTFTNDGFTTIDFINEPDGGYILAGSKRYSGYSTFNLSKVRQNSQIDFEVESSGASSVYDRAIRIFENQDSTFDVIGRFQNDKYHSTAKILTFDYDLNLLNEISPDTLVSRTEFTDAIRDHNGNYVYCCRNYYGDATGDESIFPPMISQLSSNGESNWDLEIGRVINSDGIRSGWFGITEAVEKDGYVAAGTMLINAPQRDSIKTVGAIVKIDLKGDSVWYREFSTIDTSYAFTNFRDVVVTTDGYMIIGDEQCWSGFSGCDHSSNLLILKTDLLGRIEPDSSTAVITVDDQGEFDLVAYPNPFLDQFYLQHELGKPAEYQLVDITGNILINLELSSSFETTKIPMDLYPPGTYYLQLLNDQKKVQKSICLIKYN